VHAFAFVPGRHVQTYLVIASTLLRSTGTNRTCARREFICGCLTRASHCCLFAFQGHKSHECTWPRVDSRSRCQRCDRVGHPHYWCPDLWRQWHAVTSPGVVPAPAERESDDKKRKGESCWRCCHARCSNALMLTAFITSRALCVRYVW
jgi:hypothetical protein